MLEDVSVPTLMLSLVHMTGDPKWIRGAIKPQGLFLNEVQGFMPPEMQADARKQAETIAMASGQRLGQLLTIRDPRIQTRSNSTVLDSIIDVPPPAAERDDGPIPIEIAPRPVVTHTQVHVSFALLP